MTSHAPRSGPAATVQRVTGDDVTTVGTIDADPEAGIEAASGVDIAAAIIEFIEDNTDHRLATQGRG